MSKRRRGSRFARPAASTDAGPAAPRPLGVRPTGVRPKGRSRQAAATRWGASPAAIATLAVGGIVVAGIALAAATSLGLVGSSPTPTPAAVEGCPTSQPPALAAGETRTVTIRTELGDVVIKVDGSLSPIAAGNFVALAECGFYDGVVFHRTATLEDGTPFVVQGGDGEYGRSGSIVADELGRGGPGYRIRDEPVTATYHRGTVAMARSQAPNSQGSQFFIVLDAAAGPILASANTYAIFGEVASGMDVVDAIYAASGGVDFPEDPIAMTDVSVGSP